MHHKPTAEKVKQQNHLYISFSDPPIFSSTNHGRKTELSIVPVQQQLSDCARAELPTGSFLLCSTAPERANHRNGGSEKCLDWK